MRSPKGKGKQAAEAPRGGALSFKHLPEEAAKRLLDCANPTEVETQVAALLDLGDASVNLLTACILDYYVSAVLWSRGRGHTAAQLSTVYSVAHELLEGLRPPTCRSLLDSVYALKAMLADVGADEPSDLSGGLEQLGGVMEARDLTTYMSLTLFQHHSLFEFAFQHAPAEDLLGCDLNIEVAPPADAPPFPPPLPEGLPVELFQLLAARGSASGAKSSREASELTADAAPEVEREEEEAAAAKSKTPGAEAADLDAIFAELSPEEVGRVVEEVCRDELAGVEQEVAVRLRDKENEFIARLNKIHKVAPE